MVFKIFKLCLRSFFLKQNFKVIMIKIDLKIELIYFLCFGEIKKKLHNNCWCSFKIDVKNIFSYSI